MGDREREGLQSLVGLLQIPRPLLVGDVPLERLAALALAPGVEPVQGVAAFSVLGRLGLVLGGPGPAALDVGLDVDPRLGFVGVAALGVGLDVDPRLGFVGVAALGVGLDVDPRLGLPRVTALDIDPVLGVAGVAPLAVDGSLSLILVVLESFTDHAVAAPAGRRFICGGLLVLWFPGHLSHPASPAGPTRPAAGWRDSSPLERARQHSHLEEDQPRMGPESGPLQH